MLHLRAGNDEAHMLLQPGRLQIQNYNTHAHAGAGHPFMVPSAAARESRPYASVWKPHIAMCGGAHVGVGVQALVGAERAAGDGAEQRGALAARARVVRKRVAGEVALRATTCS